MKKARRRGRSVVALGLVLPGLLLVCPYAYALDPALDVSQYAHTSWKIRDGFAKDSIEAIAQTPDGYVWVGTQSGLLRFDGVRAVPWQPPTGEKLPSDYVRSLLVARDGTLWIATLKGLASWKDGKLTQYPDFAGKVIGTILQDHEGTVWFGVDDLGDNGRLCAIDAERAKCYGAGSFGRAVFALYEDEKGSLWVAAQNGVWRWAPGPPAHYALRGDGVQASAMIQDDSGTLLVGTNDGLKQLVGGEIRSYTLPGVGAKFKPSVLFHSSDGSLWIGSQQGLFHLHQGRVDEFTATDGLSGDFIDRIFEDREGSVWVSTIGGLDRFRDYAVPTISRQQGLRSTAWSVQAASDGSVWIGGPDGLNRSQDGHTTVYGKRSEPERRDRGEPSVSGTATEISNSGFAGTPRSLGLDDPGRLWASSEKGVFYFEGGRFARVPGVPGGHIYSIAGDGQGNVWILNSIDGLYSWKPDGSTPQQVPWTRFSQELALALLPDRSQGGLWIGFYKGGIAYLKDGQVRASFNAADGLGEGGAAQLRFDSRGALWIATQGGLSRVKNGQVATLTSKNGLPCDTVNWSIEDNDHAVWLYMACGLVRIARSELDAWVSDSKRAVQLALFDSSDGVRTVGISGGYGPRVTKSPDGKMWFAAPDGVSVIDPLHLPFNKLPPPVHIEQITADRKTYWQNWFGDASSSPPKLPPLVLDLTIDYTALSLVAAEKVLFRYKLEGFDSDWQDVGTRRQAFYTNLGPRKYRFRVMACNNSGVWNEEGAALDFAIAPAYYQTNWFRVLCVATFATLLWGLHQLRLRRLAWQFKTRLEERVNERTRIARELHDTLLQSFQGVLLLFYSVLQELQPGKTKQKIESVIDTAQGAINEGRRAVQGLRTSTTVQNDLADAIKTLGEGLAADPANQNAAALCMAVEGTSRNLHPIVRDEVYRIAGEVLRNAFQHAVAKRIEVEIHYDDRQLRVLVRDDGKGIDPKVLSGDGREGHYGLRGMQERAKLAGGKLTVWSKPESGTEVELCIPAGRAYAPSAKGRRSWFAKKSSRTAVVDE